jgi:hypothetical protein
MQTLTTSEFGNPQRIRFGDPKSGDLLRSGTPILGLSFRDGEDFIDCLVEGRGQTGELLVQTKAAPPPGTIMVAEIRWPDLPNRVYVRVEARGRTRDGRLVLRINSDESAKRDFLVRVACGTAGETHVRRFRRYCVRVPVEWRTFGTQGMQLGLAEDLSVGGMLIDAKRAAVGVGDSLVVRVPVLDSDIVVTGLVQHVQRRRLAGTLLIGCQFEQRQSGEQRTLRRLLRTCASRGVLLVDAE